MQKESCKKDEADMEYYLTVLTLLERYFNSKNWKKLFLEGGCYWLANQLHEGIPGSYLMINRCEEHCGIYFGRGLYDVRGKIPTLNYKYATERDISYMKQHYRPHFDTGEVEEYLGKELLKNDGSRQKEACGTCCKT